MATAPCPVCNKMIYSGEEHKCKRNALEISNEIGFYSPNIFKDITDINYSELFDKIERYEKVLKFYAKKEHYLPLREEDEDRTDAFNLVDLDSGELARETLKITN